MTDSNSLKLGELEVVFDGEKLAIFRNDPNQSIAELQRAEILALFDYISRYTHSDLNRRSFFRVPVIEYEQLTVRLAINLKLLEGHAIDLSLNGIMIQLEDHVDVPIDTPVLLQLAMGQKQVKIEAILRRQKGNELSFQFAPSTISAKGEPPEIVLQMFNELQRVWLSSRFRSRPL